MNSIRGLDELGWANIDAGNNSLYWAHLILFVGLVSFVCYIIHIELIFYVRVRDALFHFLPPNDPKSEDTIVMYDVPRSRLKAIHANDTIFPGGIDSVIVADDLTKLLDLLQKKRKTKTSLRVVQRELTASGPVIPAWADSNKADKAPKDWLIRLLRLFKAPTWSHSSHKKARQHPESLDRFEVNIKGKSTKIIYANNVSSIASVLDDSDLERLSSISTVLIRFRSRKTARLIVRAVQTAEPGHISVQRLNAAVTEVRWSNLAKPFLSRLVSQFLSVSAMCILLALWSVPVAFMGALSQMTTLGDKFAWLRWIQTVPTWVNGLI